MSKPVILCVDDEQMVLDSLKEQLLDHFAEEYTIETAESGEDALELFDDLVAEQKEVPLIISDCVMPDMKGDQLLAQIHAIAPKTLKVMLTGQASSEAVINAVNHANLYHYVPKPWEREDLVLTVTEALRSYFKDKHIEEQNQTLRDMNTMLIDRTTALSHALERLKTTQEELIHSEKMAALGQLIAGVAHEINTPMGAIHSAVGNITRFLDHTIEQLPAVFLSLPQELQRDFFTLLRRSLQNVEPISLKEERQLKRALVRQLENLEIQNAISLAGNLVEMGIYQELEDCFSLLKHPDSAVMVQTAYKLSSLQRSTQTIAIAVDKVSKVVFALRTFARYDHSGEKILTNLVEGIETVLTLYHHQLKNRVAVVRNYAEVPSIWGYPDELHQVWMNLIHNALQAMSNKGTLQIEVSLQYSTIVKVGITDSGTGIPEHIKPRIFEPFFTTKPPGEGSGLGLDIVNKIIKKHGGEITVESVPGKTTFSVFLPVQ